MFLKEFRQTSPFLNRSFCKIQEQGYVSEDKLGKRRLVRQLNLECEFSVPYSGSLYSSIQFSLPL